MVLQVMETHRRTVSGRGDSHICTGESRLLWQQRGGVTRLEELRVREFWGFETQRHEKGPNQGSGSEQDGGARLLRYFSCRIDTSWHPDNQVA